MRKLYGKMVSSAVLAAGLLVGGLAVAQELIITSFQDGYLSWTNVNSNLYYTVEYRPNLTGTNTWDGSHRVSQDIKSVVDTITVPVGVFYRVVGSTNPMHTLSAAVPKTGQTNLYQTGDDGDYKKGVAWPNPRFTVGTGVDGTNCVTDNLTGLMWARNANLAGPKIWYDAIVYCEGLTYGGYSDWRLPNVKELQSLLDYGRFSPPLCNTAGTGHWTENDPFTGVQWSGTVHVYWLSTTVAFINYAWHVDLATGEMSISSGDKTLTYRVWPVRGGE